LKALRALPHWSPEIDEFALGEFLQYGYIAAPRTIYKEIHKLQAGHWLCLDAHDAPKIAPYWSLIDVLEKGELEGDPRELEEELEALLVDAFRYRLVSDVPVGLFLSGGIDSSLVASLLSKSDVTLKAFTIGFESAEHDESESAARLARNLGLEHHLTRISMDEATNILGQWPDLYDEPFGDHSGIPTYLVAHMASEQVKVALSADGGDELFCGYAGYGIMANRMALHGKIPCLLRKAGGGILNAIATSPAMDLATPGTPYLHRTLGHGLVYDRVHKMRNFLSASSGVAAVRSFRTFWQSREVARLMGIPYDDPRLNSLAWPGKPIEQLTATDFHEYLPDNVLVKVDRASMATSLESREPLLDHRIVEFAFRLPLLLRHGSFGNKHILRSILYRNVPRELVDRPKQGFAVPLGKWMDHWLSSGAVNDSIDILHEKMPWLDTHWLDSQLYAFAGSPQGKNRLWLIYVLGQWAQRWL
jgi:asparagine synthase (glutamine-hydrolysing)